MRVGLYARVSTHDQQTLGLQLQAMRSYVRDRGWTLGPASPGRRLGGEGTPPARGVAEGGPPPRDRRGDRVAARSVGPLPGRSGGDAPGAERAGGGLRVADRG